MAAPTVRTEEFVAFDRRQPFPFVNIAVLLRPVFAASDPLLDRVREFFAPEGLELVEVRDADALATFDTTLVEAYPVPEMRGRRQFGPGVLDAPGWRLWLGLLDGARVGTAAAHVTDSFVDVEWISLRPEARGRR